MARRPRRAAGGEEFIRGLVQSNSFVIAKVCTERPRGLSVGSASEFFLSGSVTRRSRPGDDVSRGTMFFYRWPAKGYARLWPLSAAFWLWRLSLVRQ